MTKSRVGLKCGESESHQNKEINYWEARALGEIFFMDTELTSMKTWGREENYNPGVKVFIEMYWKLN